MKVFLRYFGIVLLLGTICTSVVFATKAYWNKINPEPTEEELFLKEVDKISSIDHFDEDINLNTKEPFAMLLLGVDGNSFNATRSDSIMIAIIDPENNKVSLLSVPRDLRVSIPGENGHDKINAAFAKGGVDLTAKTIEETFGIPIDYFATINFKGFQELVDTLGGIELDVEKDLTFKDRITKKQFSLQKGPQKLDGIQALNYARFRGDGEGDFGRMRRQQQVIKAIVEQTMNFRNIPKIIDIIGVVDKNFNSNVSYKDLGTLAIKMRNVSGDNIDSLHLDAEPQMINGVSYVVAEESAINSTSNQIRALLSE